MLGQIFRGGTDDALAIHDAAHPQIGVFQHAQLERDIHAFAHDIDLVVGQAEPDLDVRIFVVKLWNARCDEPSAEAERRRDANRSLRILGQFRYRRLGFFHSVEYLDGAVIERAAMFRRRQLARRPVEEPDPRCFSNSLIRLLATAGDARWSRPAADRFPNSTTRTKTRRLSR